MGAPSHRVSPELEAVWQKHAAHIAWTRSPTTSEYKPSIARLEGQIHALSPPPRARNKKRSQSLQTPVSVSVSTAQQRVGEKRRTKSLEPTSTSAPATPSVGTSGPRRLLDQIQEVSESGHGSAMRHASGSDDHTDGGGVLPAGHNNSSPPREDPLSHLRERARSRKRLTLTLQQANSVSASIRVLESKNIMSAEIIDGEPKMGAAEQGVLGAATVVNAAGARPFLVSHGRKGSGSSVSTITMASSDSTRPASTVEEARISISSTLYNSSDMQPFSDIADRTSFIDLRSPGPQELSFVTDPAPPPRAHRFSPMSHSSVRHHNPDPRDRSRSPKPPIPTSPKPDFTLRRRDSPSTSGMPPTTNYLQPDTRADLVRKSKKLTSLFGQTPGADVMPSQFSFLEMPPSPRVRQTHARGAMSVSASPDSSYYSKSLPGTPSLERRHSTSIPPDSDFYIDIGSQEGGDTAESPPASFMDLSDDEDSAHQAPPSPSTRSMFESMSPDEQQEELRRRKREKLAKLHRFLGSRVPTSLVLGLEDPTLSLPPPLASPKMDHDDKRVWLPRRRSSSVAAFPAWSDDYDRVNDNLCDKEKAINVRRAHKMEKVFGVAPPQTLYHTRQGPSQSALDVTPKFLSSRSSSSDSVSQPASPKGSTKLKSKKTSRPSTADSSRRHLLSKGSVTEDAGRGRSGSLMYTHYQYSLNSLVDIIDRDDRESLAELHEYLNTPSPTTPIAPSTSTSSSSSDARRLSLRSERRRSLPTRTSLTSLASEYSLADALPSPKIDVTDFQLRRRRAAKLQAFFGVDYKHLIQDVLDSIENGLEHECKRGTINPEEADDLLKRLREIKTKREGSC